MHIEQKWSYVGKMAYLNVSASFGWILENKLTTENGYFVGKMVQLRKRGKGKYLHSLVQTCTNLHKLTQFYSHLGNHVVTCANLLNLAHTLTNLCKLLKKWNKSLTKIKRTVTCASLKKT